MVQTRSSHSSRSAWLSLNDIDHRKTLRGIDAIRAQYRPVVNDDGMLLLERQQ